jgi:hypothetical protein
MAGFKTQTNFAVQEDLLGMLDEAASKYNLPSRDKALRCILDYVAKDGDWDEIFGQIRCMRCGRRPGWTKGA